VTITIELAPELQAELARQAARQGVGVTPLRRTYTHPQPRGVTLQVPVIPPAR